MQLDYHGLVDYHQQDFSCEIVLYDINKITTVHISNDSRKLSHEIVSYDKNF